MKILITGDLVINKEYSESDISDSVKALFKQSDLNIVNLEAPVTTSTSQIIKTGPHLKSNEKSTLEVLKALKIDAVTLANNHLLDFDEKGVKDTLKFCEQNKIQTVGAGMNLKEATKTKYFDTKEGKIALVNFAENEWSSATKESAGANPIDIIDNTYQIKEAKKNADFVFVIVHGGHEYYNLPSPRMQKQYRFYAEQGADIVIGHHTHCISGNEVYNGVPIYYSLGNFLFTKPSLYEDWYNGLVLEVEIQNRKVFSKIHPIEQEKDTYKLKLTEGDNKQNTFNRILNYNKIIKNETQLKQNWDLFIQANYDSYINRWSPLSLVKSRYLKAVIRKSGIKVFNKKEMALSLNLMRCEAHRELSIDALKKYLNK